LIGSKYIGDSMPPCGTPALILAMFEKEERSS